MIQPSLLRSRLPAGLALALAASGAQAQTSPAPSLEDISRRLQAVEQRLGAAPQPNDATTAADLDRRLRIIERKLESHAGETSAKTASAPAVALSADKGLSVKSPAPSGAEIKFRALVQGDGRFYFDDGQDPQNDTFLFRRVEPTVEGSWGEWIGFRLNAQLAGDSATLNDAYVDLKFDPRATLRIGKTKVPVGLERLQSSSSLAMVEQAFPAELAPGRDIGVQLQGEFADSALSYALGAYNGTVDGRDGATTNPDNDFEWAGRIFAEPWKNADNALSGLGFGIGASSGEKRGSGNNFLPRYRTPGQATFFNYRSAVTADGGHTRWSPQAYYYRNAFGLMGEYIRSKQEVLLTASGERADLDHSAWQLTAGWVLTGENASYRGVVKPNQPFTLGSAGWGALELVARYGRLAIDDGAFPRFADPAAAAAEASGWGLGLNWYLTGNLKLVANYTQTRFEGGAAAGADREDEKAFFTRAQFSF
ncbi:OprO/OprP family phosphate-selective porin [Luteimonas sp. SX5]|uniref:OprO/OprP family phosphate-selective porin n=1 Tax=Luteimonas galliterrae TaxID=2940486 RepID=A0ABT0MIN5_9GAMM|nr:porin [Luteimonas galliterrae]MCL1634732.1 OprO/OprP family phosphate-selective porin [Luteimonas galliterrae]